MRLYMPFFVPHAVWYTLCYINKQSILEHLFDPGLCSLATKNGPTAVVEREIVVCVSLNAKYMQVLSQPELD